MYLSLASRISLYVYIALPPSITFTMSMMNGFKRSSQFLTFSILIFLVLPNLVHSECKCENSDQVEDKTKALRCKIAALLSIVVASAIGVCIPLLGKIVPALSLQRDIFFMIKASAVGVILSTGFIHVLPDVSENLTSPCLSDNPWGDFPFTGFVAMCTATEPIWLMLMPLFIFRNIINVINIRGMCIF